MTYFDMREVLEAHDACPACGTNGLGLDTSVVRIGIETPPFEFTDECGRHHHHQVRDSLWGLKCRGCGAKITLHKIGACWCGWPDVPEQGGV